MSLRATQRLLSADILAHAAAERGDAADLAAALRLPRGVDAERRMAVYRDGYPARILDAVRDAYPAIANICGDGSFANLVRRYVRACDVAPLSLNEIGRLFPEHCERDELAQRLPFLADLARLEWAVLRAFHSREREPANATSFATWDIADWDRASFAWQPAIAIMRSAWPVLDLWQTRDTRREEINLALADRPQVVVVFRRGLDVACELLSPARATALEALLRGATLGAAMENLAALGSPPDAATAMFRDWLSAGWITGISAAPR